MKVHVREVGGTAFDGYRGTIVLILVRKNFICSI